MRRSAQIVSGHNYYRKANEILKIDQQKPGSFGVLDELKAIPDGVSILGMSGFRLLRGGAYVADQQIITSKGGFVFEIPSTALANEIVIQPNFGLTGDFSFEFDITDTTAGSGYSMGFYLYAGSPFSQYYLKANFNYASFLRLAWSTHASGGSGDYFDPAYTKIRFVRSGSGIQCYSYKPSAWSSRFGPTAVSSAMMNFMFFYTTLTSANYVEAEYKNFVLNAGQTQILW